TSPAVDEFLPSYRHGFLAGIIQKEALAGGPILLRYENAAHTHPVLQRDLGRELACTVYFCKIRDSSHTARRRVLATWVMVAGFPAKPQAIHTTEEVPDSKNLRAGCAYRQ